MFFRGLWNGKRKKLVKNVDTIVDGTLFRTDDILDARQEIIDQFDELVSALSLYDAELTNIAVEIDKSRSRMMALSYAKAKEEA